MMTPEEKAIERFKALLTGAKRREREVKMEIMQLNASLENLQDPQLTLEERVKVFEAHVHLLPLPQQIIIYSYLEKVKRGE